MPTAISHHTALVLASVAALCAAQAGPARADPPGVPQTTATADYINPDRPGIADGSTTIGPDHVQAELGFQYEYHRDPQGHFQLFFMPTLLRFGLSDTWEIRVEGNSYTWQRARQGGQVAVTDGFQPASIGVKYHFMDDGGFSRPSVGAILRVFPAWGTGAFHTRITTGDMRLVADWNFASTWSLNPNIGVARYEDAGGHAVTPALFAMTLNYNPSPVLNFFVDTGMQSAEAHRGRASIVVDAGTAVIIGHDVQLDASVGWGAAGLTTPQPFVAVGVSKRF